MVTTGESRDNIVSDGDASTLVTLRDYLERMMAAHCEANDAQFENIKLSTQVASTSLQARLDLLNEFRAMVEDRNRTYITRDLVDSMFMQVRRENEELRAAIRLLELRESDMRGRSTAYGIALTVVFSLITIGMRFL